MKYKPIFIEATTINDAWFQLIWNLDKYGRKYKISSGSHSESERLAFDYISGFLSYPHERPLAPEIPFNIDIMYDLNDEKIENYFANYLMNSELEENENYRYSSWINGDKNKHYCSYNQIDWIINHFLTHGYENEHCYLQIGNSESNLIYDKPYKFCPKCTKPHEDFIYEHKIQCCPFCGLKLEKDETKRGSSPCLRGLDFRIIDGYLTTHVIYRSWDLIGGFPTNMGGFALLNEYVAEHLDGIEPGALSFSCKSLHAYNHHINLINKRLRKK